MRKDFNASMQMPNAFTDRDEESRWSDENEALSKITHSFSGHERNRLFLNQHAEQFLDVSGVSGVDSPADGRVFVTLDYDRDGWHDFAVISSSRPLLQLFRNQLGDLRRRDANAATTTAMTNHVVAVRFNGGNRLAESSDRFSTRDGYGAQVRVRAGDLKLLREHRCGEGMAGQNSATMLIGIGSHRVAEEVEIKWPSGHRQTIKDVAAGSLVTVFENPDDSANAAGYELSEYLKTPISTSPTEATHDVASISQLRFRKPIAEPGELTVVTTFASWCAACARHQPLLQSLPGAFDAGCIQIVGFPIDRDDEREQLEAFASRNDVAYPLLLEPDESDRDAVERLLNTAGDANVLPSSIVTDAEGNVLLVTSGLPTVSQLKKLLTGSRRRRAETAGP